MIKGVNESFYYRETTVVGPVLEALNETLKSFIVTVPLFY